MRTGAAAGKIAILAVACIFTMGGMAFFFLSGQHHPDRNAVYIKPIPNAIVELNPTKSRFRLDYIVGRAIMGQILGSGFDGEIKPAFIRRWEIGSSAKRFVFQIRTDVNFHSGRRANVRDLIFTLNYLAAKDSLVSWLFEDIHGYSDYVSGRSAALEGIKQIGPDKLAIDLDRPSYVFLSNLADPKIVLLPSGLNGFTETEFFQNPDGIGPYTLSKGKITDSEFELSSFQGYYLGRPGVSKYRFVVMSYQEATERYIRGDVFDLESFSLTSELKEKLKNVGSSFTIGAYSGTSLFFNGRSSRVRDRNVRRAISRVLNVEAAAEECKVSVSPASGFIPKGVTGWGNPETTLSPLDEVSGHFHPKVTIRMLSYGEENNSCLLKKIVGQLKSNGIKLSHVHVDSETALKIFTNGDYDILFDHLSMRGAEPFHLLAYVAPGSPHDLLRFKDKWIEYAIDKVKEAPTDIARSNLYRELDQYISKDRFYIIPLFDDVRDYFFSKRVHASFLPTIINLNTGFEEVWIE